MTSIPLVRGPAYHLGEKKKDGPQTPTRRPIEEEARSVHTDRHYDKSARSNKSQERSGRSQDDTNKSPAREGSTRSRNASANSNQSDNKSQKSGRSASKDQSPASNRSASVNYAKLTSSLVSNPDNLVCDDCVNKDIDKHRRDKDAALRAADKEHANRTNADLRKQLEQEKERHLEKLRLYKEGVEGQNADLQAKRAAAKDADEKEKDRIRRQLADKSDLIAQEQEAQARRDKFRGDLADQVAANRDHKDKRTQDQLDADRKNHNLVIDDAWRGPHQKALKDYYKDNLLGQLADNNDARNNARDAQKDADAKYVDEVRAYNDADRAQRARIEAEKKELLKNELSKQLGENQDKRELTRAEKDVEDAQHRDKIAFDNDVFYKNMEKRKNLVQGHMQDLINQKQDAEDARKQAELDGKKPQGTGLHVPQKVKKCYNCALCKASKPIERLNKRYRKVKN